MQKAPESNFYSIHLNYNAIIIIPMLELYTPSAGISSSQRRADLPLLKLCECVWHVYERKHTGARTYVHFLTLKG